MAMLSEVVPEVSDDWSCPHLVSRDCLAYTNIRDKLLLHLNDERVSSNWSPRLPSSSFQNGEVRVIQPLVILAVGLVNTGLVFP